MKTEMYSQRHRLIWHAFAIHNSTFDRVALVGDSTDFLREYVEITHFLIGVCLI